MPALNVSDASLNLEMANRHENRTTKKSIPWVVSVIIVTVIQKNGPLITSDSQFPIPQFVLDPKEYNVNHKPQLIGADKMEALSIRPI